MHSIIQYFIKSKSLGEFEQILLQNEYRTGIAHWLRKCLVQGVLLYVLSLAVLVAFRFEDLYITVIPLALLFLVFLFNYFFQLYRFERRKGEIEKLVPDVLLQASVFPKGTDLVKIISYLSNANYGFLSTEFGKALQEIKKGSSVEEALENVKNRNKSKVLNRAIDLLVHGYRSGAEMNKIFKESAEDLLETNSILREREATLIVEKYTLLFAGGLIVPLVLGLLVGLVYGLNFSMLSELEIGMSPLQRKELLNAALLANQLYIAEYSVIASCFVANQERNLKKAFIYVSILLPLSFIAYNLAQLAYIS